MLILTITDFSFEMDIFLVLLLYKHLLLIKYKLHLAKQINLRNTFLMITTTSTNVKIIVETDIINI